MKTIKILLVAAMVSVTLSCNSKTEAAKEKADMKQTAVEQPAAKAAQDSVNADDEWLPTVIDFSATWCGPCRMIAPEVHKLAEKYDGAVKFQFVDIDRQQDLAMKYGVEAVPTFVILDPDGKETNRIVGANVEGLVNAIEYVIANQ